MNFLCESMKYLWVFVIFDTYWCERHKKIHHQNPVQIFVFCFLSIDWEMCRKSDHPIACTYGKIVIVVAINAQCHANYSTYHIVRTKRNGCKKIHMNWNSIWTFFSANKTGIFINGKTTWLACGKFLQNWILKHVAKNPCGKFPYRPT